MIEFQRTRRRSSEVELTPLIDVVFQLLVFFLLTSTMMTRTIPVELPEAETAERADSPVVVSVDQAGQLFFNARPVEAAQLRALVRTAREEDPKMQAVVSADRRAAHAHFVTLLDLLRQEGVNRFGIQVDEPATEPPEQP